jgi:uncharacterized protein YcfL
MKRVILSSISLLFLIGCSQIKNEASPDSSITMYEKPINSLSSEEVAKLNMIEYFPTTNGTTKTQKKK